MDIYEDGFGSIYEGPTISGEDYEVTENGKIRIDTDRLMKYGEDDVVMAIVAHELAHYHLKH